MRSFIACGEMFCAPSAMPWIRPVSSCGKKPLGISMNSTPVKATVEIMTIKVTKRWRSATTRPRS